jgi:uncharacterized membrane protein
MNNKKTCKSNIILINLDAEKMQKILEFAHLFDIGYTFDKDIYPSEFYDINTLMYTIVSKNKKIPICFKKTIENLIPSIEDCADDEKNNNQNNIFYTNLLKKINDIEWV